MKDFILKTTILFLTLLVITEINTQVRDSTAKNQQKALGIPANVLSGKFNPDPKAQWFPRAGLGLFIHWGIAAIDGGIDLSWGMLANKSWINDGTVTPNEYYELIKKWNPSNFDMDKLLKLAKEAGFRYAVFVTKHHDGFTFWPSNYGEIGTKKTFNGRDFVREFSNACEKYGLKKGFYYSPPDWYFDRQYRNWSYDDSVWLDMNHKIATKKIEPSNHDSLRTSMVKGQLYELLTNYGKVDLMWFDGGNGELPNSEVRALQPGIVINRRNNESGDYNDTEGRLPDKRFYGWFETCDPCWPTHWWSYSSSDTYDDASTFLTNLIKLRAWGGNYLANIGPLPDGSIPKCVYSIWNEIAVWMKHSGESVYETTAGYYPEKSSVPTTNKTNITYCFALPGFQGSIVLSGVEKPNKIVLLRNKQEISYVFKNGILSINIPAHFRTQLPDVVKIVW